MHRTVCLMRWLEATRWWTREPVARRALESTRGEPLRVCISACCVRSSLCHEVLHIRRCICAILMFAVENLEHNDFLALRTMLIRWTVIIKPSCTLLYSTILDFVLSCWNNSNFRENLLHCRLNEYPYSSCRTHMQDLKEVTAAIHYENFRFEKLRVIASKSNFDASAGRYVLIFGIVLYSYCLSTSIWLLSRLWVQPLVVIEHFF